MAARKKSVSGRKVMNTLKGIPLVKEISSIADETFGGVWKSAKKDIEKEIRDTFGFDNNDIKRIKSVYQFVKGR